MNERQDSVGSIAVVGGGMLGMTVALRLAQAGRAVTLYEAAPHLGGLADAWTLGDIVWDRHYHVTLMSDTYTRKIVDELGLSDMMNWVETRTGFYTDGKLYSMSNTVEFLRFPPLRLIDKLRLGGTIFYASKVRNWRKLESISVADWLTKLSGKRTFEKIWRPLLRAKLGENYRETSAAFIWATIARMYAARRTGLKKEMFGYLTGGYDRLISTFQRRLEQLGVDIQCSADIRQVTAASTDRERVTLTMADGARTMFSQAVLTVPPSVVARLCRELTAKERDLFQGIKYQGVVCSSVLLKKPLAGYYVTNITDDWVPFTGVIEMTALVDPTQIKGLNLVYLPKYVPVEDPLFERSDEDIREEAIAALCRLYPHLSADDVVDFRVSRAKYVMPIPRLGYSQSLPPVKTSLDNVFAINSAHIVNGTLNVNETIKLAEDAVQRYLHVPTSGTEPSGRERSTQESHDAQAYCQSIA